MRIPKFMQKAAAAAVRMPEASVESLTSIAYFIGMLFMCFNPNAHPINLFRFLRIPW